ncbi:M23 family metallopeptidase [Aequorivita lipolytica]|uniref:M23 family metallopeptidase n=1 Tax=Aequorivita lipolytica TaxID=153267 RepID=A0A5C6YQZ9_9FLAO|nr:M23 family metallopeptidase [Aequorivita lipolytica]TXD69346.1 M23 family metallopeptidase [Aequorivita lipolytica]SRX53696.1 Murein DD-endopeptidase MepM [Aequorivita lipolytica]
MNYKILFVLMLFGILILGCKQVRKVADVIVQPTAREVYERNFSKKDSLLLRWKNAFENSKRDSIQITLPYSESGVFSEENFNVYSYNIQLKEGERIVVEVEKQPDSAIVFIDIFQAKSDSLKIFKLLKSSEDKKATLSQEIETSGFYKVIVQAQMQLQFPFVLKIYTEPLYEFPVSGGGNKNIQSFWADPRDAGSRSHEGVDIFADRGTPVVAVTDGMIASAGERGLGGKQVWLRDGLFGKTVYYAHLDSIAVSEGEKVKVGDTLGFVGNTGNAKTTAPHLHFGIYKSKGAVNPLSFIKKTEIQPSEKPSAIVKAVTLKNRVDVRKGPASAYKEFGSLKKNDTLIVLGKNQKWYHIQTTDSLKGYVNETVIKPLPPN